MKELFVFIIGVISVTVIFAQGDWELKKEKDGIKVYLRDVEGSRIQEFKAEAILDGKLSSIVAVLKDVNSYTDLYKHTKEARLLNENDTFSVYYIVTNLPWPLTDRDAVYSSTYSQQYDTKLVRIDIKLETGYMEENGDYIRMEKATGLWLLHPVDVNKVEVTYQMLADPGGKIPGWVINMFLVDTPVEDIKVLQERVKLEKYANRKFDFLVDY